MGKSAWACCTNRSAEYTWGTMAQQMNWQRPCIELCAVASFTASSQNRITNTKNSPTARSHPAPRLRSATVLGFNPRSERRTLRRVRAKCACPLGSPVQHSSAIGLRCFVANRRDSIIIAGAGSHRNLDGDIECNCRPEVSSKTAAYSAVARRRKARRQSLAASLQRSRCDARIESLRAGCLLSAAFFLAFGPLRGTFSRLKVA